MKDDALKQKPPPELAVHNRDTSIEQAVMEFVVWFSGDDNKTVTPDTLVLQGLGIDGVEGRDFLISFARRFAVDISDLQKHESFRDDGHRGRFSLWRLITRGKAYPGHRLKDLRISDLVRAAEQKVLPPQ